MQNKKHHKKKKKKKKKRKKEKKTPATRAVLTNTHTHTAIIWTILAHIIIIIKDTCLCCFFLFVVFLVILYCIIFYYIVLYCLTSFDLPNSSIFTMVRPVSFVYPLCILYVSFVYRFKISIPH